MMEMICSPCILNSNRSSFSPLLWFTSIIVVFGLIPELSLDSGEGRAVDPARCHEFLKLAKLMLIAMDYVLGINEEMAEHFRGTYMRLGVPRSTRVWKTNFRVKYYN